MADIEKNPPLILPDLKIEEKGTPETKESEYKMKLSLMRRQLQNDYTLKVKNII